MTLSTKPDFARVCTVWSAFWEKQITDRPIVWATVSKPGARKAHFSRKYHQLVTGNLDAYLEEIDIQIEGTEYLAESIPLLPAGPVTGPVCRVPGYGPRVLGGPARPRTG